MTPCVHGITVCEQCRSARRIEWREQAQFWALLAFLLGLAIGVVLASEAGVVR